ncbi:hypothetical protein [Paenibacillus polymyxa]|uniref:hypothetical protein n=1 Tax=Paenibacillus polymyxa TaxID=1406 RepID=UPI0004DFBBC9|nr:hypothetical protein [Paenibacillus polymyxa]KJD38090.1 hypothetical protein QD46_21480 [Paenibacillus polymyxa]MBY7740276.1 hypothetical protein [Paenibacillus polymyxa]MEE4581005.1 hypothetical protein [Paenibacillus polymyxa]RPE03364.1 hypothetical protein EG487_14365 [Paenibacillus polymyxa]
MLGQNNFTSGTLEKNAAGVLNTNLVVEENGSFLMIIEESEEVNGKLTGYIPAFRLGVAGDTNKDLQDSARDLIKMSLEANIKPFTNVGFMMLNPNS